MKRVKEVIAVEGKYDKIKLCCVVDATVVETRGFGVFKDRDRQKLLKTLARERGIIIFTDSDGAGFVIRNFLKAIVEPRYIKNAYIPDVFGKEKRKSSPSKEGKLGVEGMSAEVIVEALIRAGATIDEAGTPLYSEPITKADLYALGLSGGGDSARRRRLLQERLHLPERMSANALLDVLNIITTRSELFSIVSRNQ